VGFGGDEQDVHLSHAVYNGIIQEDLVTKVKRTGKILDSHIGDVQKSSRVKAVRIQGTTMWVDTTSPEDTLALVAHMKNKGVLVQQNGTRGIIARPSLVFGKIQAVELIRALKKFK